MEPTIGHDLLMILIGLFGAVIIFILAMLIISNNQSPKTKGRILFVTNFDNIKTAIITMELKNNQFVQGTLEARDAKGDPAEIQSGSVTASSSDENVCTVEQDPDDEKKLKIVGQHAGAAVVTVGADADLGEGVVPIEAQVAVQITSGQATGLGVTFGEPQDQ